MQHPVSGSCITIGNFDGVHLGHQSLIRLAGGTAESKGQPLTLITFWPHPRSVILGPDAHKPLTSREERRRHLEGLGVDNILELSFTRELARLSPEEFLCRHLLPLGLKTLVIGHDFTLGREREGDAAKLAELAEKYNFELLQAPPFCLRGAPVSSTRLRQCLESGNVEQAAEMLGRPHSTRGRITHGHGRGKGLGFPTANMVQGDALLPGNGVYAVMAESGGCQWQGVTNVGRNPTFGPASLSVETFILDTDINLYGDSLCLKFIARLREEQAFPSAAALSAQIAFDVARARAVLSNNPWTDQ